MGASPLSGKWWGVRWQGDRKAIERYLMRVVDGIDSRLIGQVGELVINQIVSRTSRGFDVDGKPFQDYGDRYAKYKSTIRSPFPVNLALFDEMLPAMKFRWIRSGGSVIITIYFEGNLQQVKAWVHDTGGLSGRRGARFNMPRRHFFGINPREMDALNERVLNRLRELIRESLPGARNLF